MFNRIEAELKECLGATEELQGVFATGGKLGEHTSLDIRFRPGLHALKFSSLIRTRLGPLLKESRSDIEAWVPLGAGEMRRKRKRQGAAVSRSSVQKRDSDRRDDRRRSRRS